MKKLAVMIGLILAPTGLCAQGLRIDFDADAFDVEAPRQDIEPQAASARTVEAMTPRRSVRYGERLVKVDGTPAARPVHVASAGSGS
ncbi:hypothetical protein [Rhizorhabdus dicambivorans]|uniref:Uncharacterized protein n=1 Tax=Rhizorhabdus dicambivorans TaxID=1850238 RepID=A0A2A4FY72_9SPHN|nr:hypothetical protein [Rhizorhabdus dicambivorans]PCE43734.1 hypothetical protein COO09_02000 [Rhizorhabdus dicambivorans]